MLSGTPMQNHLDEFYSMVSFCNPGILGTTKEFAKKYERPILAGREPCATDARVGKSERTKRNVERYREQVHLEKNEHNFIQALTPESD